MPQLGSYPFFTISKDLHLIEKHLHRALSSHSGNEIINFASKHLLSSTKGRIFYSGLTCYFGYLGLDNVAPLLLPMRNGHDPLLETGKSDGNSLVATQSSCSFHRQIELAEIVAMIHASTNIHCTITEDGNGESNDNTNNNRNVQYIRNKIAVLAGDYLLSRVSHRISKLRSNSVLINMIRSVEDISVGHKQRLSGIRSVPQYFEVATQCSGSLLQHALSSSILLGCVCANSITTNGKSEKTVPSVEQEKYIQLASDFGCNFGIAMHIFEEVSPLPLAQCSPDTLHTLLSVQLAAQKDPIVKEALHRNFTQEGDVTFLYEKVKQYDTINESIRYGVRYLNAALEALHLYPKSDLRESIQSAAMYALSRTPNGNLWQNSVM